MKSKRLFMLVIVSSFSALPSAMPQEASPASQVSKKQAVVAHASQQHENEGDRIFQQNCSRCHNAPEGFSPSISGTIVRHMRVRASLSKHDEQELVKFLNP
jgi:cytochrome c5